MKFDFTNKIVLVTGAARGMGEQISKDFLSCGATVVVTDINVPKWSTPDESKIIRVSMDVSKEDSIVNVIANINSTTSGITVIVNNAGISIESPTVSTPLENWNKMFDINITGTFICVREVVRSMIERKQKGSIVNIASTAGRNAFAGCAGYCASKAAVIGFTRSIAIEFGHLDITANAICPGTVQTDMIEAVIKNIATNTGLDPAEIRSSMEKGIPMQRFQQPSDISSLALFLASDYARNINGETLNLDGGSVRN